MTSAFRRRVPLKGATGPESRGGRKVRRSIRPPSAKESKPGEARSGLLSRLHRKVCGA